MKRLPRNRARRYKKAFQRLRRYPLFSDTRRVGELQAPLFATHTGRVCLDHRHVKRRPSLRRCTLCATLAARPPPSCRFSAVGSLKRVAAPRCVVLAPAVGGVSLRLRRKRNVRQAAIKYGVCFRTLGTTIIVISLAVAAHEVTAGESTCGRRVSEQLPFLAAVIGCLSLATVAHHQSMKHGAPPVAEQSSAIEEWQQSAAVKPFPRLLHPTPPHSPHPACCREAERVTSGVFFPACATFYGNSYARGDDIFRLRLMHGVGSAFR